MTSKRRWLISVGLGETLVLGLAFAIAVLLAADIRPVLFAETLALFLLGVFGLGAVSDRSLRPLRHPFDPYTSPPGRRILHREEWERGGAFLLVLAVTTFAILLLMALVLPPGQLILRVSLVGLFEQPV